VQVSELTQEEIAKIEDLVTKLQDLFETEELPFILASMLEIILDIAETHPGEGAVALAISLRAIADEIEENFST